MDQADNLALASDVLIGRRRRADHDLRAAVLLARSRRTGGAGKRARGGKRGKKKAPRAALTSDGRGAYLFVRASFGYYICMDLISMNSSRPNLPSSRPLPDCL